MTAQITDEARLAPTVQRREIEVQNEHWNFERVLDSLAEDESGTFGRYGAVKLRSAYQPIIGITHQRVVGYEALLRPFWDDGSQSSPAQLLANSAVRGEQLIVDRVSRAAHLANYGAMQKDAWLFLNMHPDVFSVGSHNRTFPTKLLERYQVHPHQIVLELLEHQTWDEGAFRDASVSYREQGFLLAIDDFGSGQSNFDRVWTMRPDFVKLDRSLVQRAEDNAVNQRMVRHMVALLHQAGSMVVAEGVETRRQALVMMEADVDFLQGFWLGRPAARIDEEQAHQALHRLDEAWRSFPHYDETLAREWQLSLKPYRAALKSAAHAYLSTDDVDLAASVYFGVPGALRFFVLDEHGILTSPTRPNPATTGRDTVHLQPLNPEVGSNWSRRAYFKQAVRQPEKIVIVGPHYSLRDGEGVYTAAVAVGSHGRRVVLGGDFELLSERAQRLSEATRLEPDNEPFDPTLSIIGLASGMPRGAAEGRA